MSTRRELRRLAVRVARLERPETSEGTTLRLPANGRDVGPFERRGLTLHDPRQFRAALASGADEAVAWTASQMSADEVERFNAEADTCE